MSRNSQPVNIGKLNIDSRRVPRYATMRNPCLDQDTLYEALRGGVPRRKDDGGRSRNLGTEEPRVFARHSSAPRDREFVTEQEPGEKNVRTDEKAVKKTLGPFNVCDLKELAAEILQCDVHDTINITCGAQRVSFEDLIERLEEVKETEAGNLVVVKQDEVEKAIERDSKMAAECNALHEEVRALRRQVDLLHGVSPNTPF